MRSSELSISPEDFKKAASAGEFPPIALELPMRAPSDIYQAFDGHGSMLLESAKGPFNIARYSFILLEPFAEFAIKDGNASLSINGQPQDASGHPLKTIGRMVNSCRQRPAPDLPPFQGGVAGLFSYDFLHYIERVPVTTVDDLNIPDAHLFSFDRLIAFDHKLNKAWAVVAPGARYKDLEPEAQYTYARETLGRMAQTAKSFSPTASPAKTAALKINHDVTEAQYTAMVNRAKEYIAAGDIFQANLSLRVSADIGQVPPWRLYSVLRDVNPSPFACYLNMGGYTIASSSPERLVRVDGSTVELRPIAGTRPRGKDNSEDSTMRKELLLNEKERAEHIMLIDLERNDLGRICSYGSVEVNELMTIEDYSHVMHIVSNVRGRLSAGKTLQDVVKATFPGGTITGVPKVRCMEIIDELEGLRRGPYTGSIGYMGYGGSMDLNIVIRTFVIKNQRAYVQAGAGIVADSVASREHKESLKKAEALVRTLDRLSQ